MKLSEHADTAVLGEREKLAANAKAARAAEAQRIKAATGVPAELAGAVLEFLRDNREAFGLGAPDAPTGVVRKNEPVPATRNREAQVAWNLRQLLVAYEAVVRLGGDRYHRSATLVAQARMALEDEIGDLL